MSKHVPMILVLGSRFRRRSRRSAQQRKANPEVKFSQYFQAYIDSGKSARAYMMRRPGKSLQALIALCRLPCVRIAPSAGMEGAAIRALLLGQSALWRVTGLAAGVISLPPQPDQYSLGGSKRTLRKKVSRAKRLGIYWAEVNDPQEQWSLLQLNDECERIHPNPTYRNPNPSNSDLLSYRLWLVARAADGRPLLLSVTLVDGELAVLRHFRILGTGEEQSYARYFMTKVLVEHLVHLGVRYLVDGSNVFWLSNGLRHFQRMVGFRIVRIRVARPGRGSTGRVLRDNLDVIGAEAEDYDHHHPDAAFAGPLN